jgi:hypothetical protein
VDTAVANTFKPDFGNDKEKESSNLADVMNQGVE